MNYFYLLLIFSGVLIHLVSILVSSSTRIRVWAQ